MGWLGGGGRDLACNTAPPTTSRQNCYSAIENYTVIIITTTTTLDRVLTLKATKSNTHQVKVNNRTVACPFLFFC